ncbi:hypothetical protein BJ742DRAFT_743531 [Cladochytrium replicatum]|nr:hypothetical protein BJ742DRAFT_743531 [Cladochytrium replicatum]
MTVQHANPLYDDNYATNSLNVGPYGDAITYELVPHVDSTFRGIGESSARVIFGGSLGGWALSCCSFLSFKNLLPSRFSNPDEYNGCWASCPDPIDSGRYINIDIHNQDNATTTRAPGARLPSPPSETHTLEANWLELATGDHKSRSGEQYDIWLAVYAPVGSNGYPEPIWNKETGEINRTVAEYWREHWDLSHNIVRDWKKLSKLLRGKIRVYVGTADSFYLEGEARLFDEAIVYGSFPGSGLAMSIAGREVPVIQ